FLGVPFNIASYALLTQMIAQQCDFELGDFIWTGGDVHLYSNHIQQAKQQLQRDPKALPNLHIKRKPDSIFNYNAEDFELLGYDPHPHIKASVSI
ncbi:MAG: thymidylate synthase, partial [Methylococcales bacterium]|nr:thymidylate synthase [Methylococcales bacterium]